MIPEEGAPGRETINMRSLEIPGSNPAQGVSSLIIGEDEDDIRPRRTLRGSPDEQGEEEGRQLLHDSQPCSTRLAPR